MLYFVDYDLRNRRDYTQLGEALNSLNALKVLESAYCFHHDNTNCTQLVDYFRQFIDGDDGVCVTQVSDWAAYGTHASPNDLPVSPQYH